MKLEAKFYAQNNRLYFLDGKELDATKHIEVTACEISEKCTNPDTLYGIRVSYSEVGEDEDSYNEDFLARLRDDLKTLEEKNVFAFIIPCGTDKDRHKDDFTFSMKHCARRIKDCESVIGFARPDLNADFFTEEVSAKHKHYIFFENNEDVLCNCSNLVRY